MKKSLLLVTCVLLLTLIASTSAFALVTDPLIIATDVEKDWLVLMNPRENPNLIFPGEKIVVRDSFGSEYIVQPGDSFWNIAIKYLNSKSQPQAPRPQVTETFYNDIKPVPVTKAAQPLSEQPEPKPQIQEENEGGLTWHPVILIIFLIAALAIIYFVIKARKK